MTFGFLPRAPHVSWRNRKGKQRALLFLCQRQVPDSMQFRTQYNIPSMPCGQETGSNTCVSVHQPNSWCSLGKYFTPFKMCNCMTEFLISNPIYSFHFFVFLWNFLSTYLSSACQLPWQFLILMCSITVFVVKVFSLKIGCILPGLLRTGWFFAQEKIDLFCLPPVKVVIWQLVVILVFIAK